MNKIFNNFISILTGNIGGKILFFIFSLYIARVLGKEAFGSMNFASSIISYFLMISSMGLQSYAIILLAKKNSQNNIFNKILSYRIVLGVCSLILLIIIIPIINLGEENTFMILLYGLTIITNSLNIEWYFNAIQEMKYISKSILIQNLFAFIAIIILTSIFNIKSVYSIPLCLFIGNLLSVVYLFRKMKLYNKLKYKFEFSLSELIRLLKSSFPFFFSGIFATVNCNLDSVMLGFISSNEQVGIYSSAYKIINILILGTTMIFTPIYPVLIEMFSIRDYEKINKIIINLRKIISIIILPIIIIGTCLSRDIIEFLYGVEYSHASKVLKILILYVGIFYIRELYGYQLSASENQSDYMKVVAVSSIINIILNIIFIPKFGVIAAAITTLVSELINYIFMRRICRRRLKMINNKIKLMDYIRMILIGILLGIFIYYFVNKNVNFIVITIIIIFFYGILIIIFKIIDINKIIRIVKKGEKYE